MIQAGLIPSLCNNIGGRAGSMYVFDSTVTDQQIHDAMASDNNLHSLPYLGSFNINFEPKSDGVSYRFEVVTTSKAIVGSTFAYDSRIVEGESTLAEASLSDFSQYIIRRAPTRGSTYLHFERTESVSDAGIRNLLPNPTAFNWVSGASYPSAGSELLDDGISLTLGYSSYSGGNRIYNYPLALDYGSDVTFDTFIRHVTDAGYGAGNKSIALAAWVEGAWTIVTPEIRGDRNTDGIMKTKFTAVTARYWCIFGYGVFKSTSGGGGTSYQYLKKFGLSLSTDTVADMDPVIVSKAVVLSPLAGDSPLENTAIFSGQGYAIMNIGDPQSVGADMIVAEASLGESRAFRLVECKIEVTDV